MYLCMLGISHQKETRKTCRLLITSHVNASTHEGKKILYLQSASFI